MAEQKYRVLTRGRLADGEDLEQVRARVKALCQYSDANLDRLFSGRPFLIKTDLSLEQAKRYQQALERVGVVCEINQQQTQTASLTPEVPSGKCESVIICPKCGFSQAASASCAACGLMFAKYQHARENSEKTFIDSTVHRPVTQSTASRSSGGGWLKIVVWAAVLLTVGYFGLGLTEKPGRDEVVIYTASDCEPCGMAKDFLRTAGIEYRELNIDESTENLEQFERQQVNTLPLAFIGGEKIVGFNQVAYDIAVAGFQGRQNGELSEGIIMYTQPGCPACKKARDFFNEQEIAFEEYDINDPAHSGDYRSYSPLGTPLILVGGIPVQGFSKPALEMALRQVAGR